ncbi:hypothetical protein LGT39_02360 [Demequina sp. TTPB684]|uniref:hypothetical protein n=1 Tax=unclassified Demequina TaxID=2620311 RepID=UPI001CF417F0|nr:MULTISPECIES: hypothetical protein [unclassified Demequina]MCB2411690.1 hypothetical protein [Demequina sp. TTPB684]UPU88913.1 hypothetical protein LGT36_003055 [Demequina sp. TMPB413]
MTESTETSALFDAVALWEVRESSGAAAVISAAVNAVVAGVDSPSLFEVAGFTGKESYWTIRPVVEATFEELNIPYPGPDRDEMQIAATRVMGKRLLDGELSARDLCAWAHSTIGHDGAARLQPLVELDDAYDIEEYAGADVQVLDDAAHEMAMSLLAGDPLPDRLWPELVNGFSARAATESRFRSAMRRIRARLNR